MTEVPANSQKKAAPGWYKDPKMVDTQRYWDGHAWTDHRVSMPTTEKNAARSSVPRWITAGAVAIATIAIWFSMAPENDYEDLRAKIESADDRNNENTAGAPQQEVVNGWTTIQYLNLLSIQQEESDRRRDALFVLALIGGAVGVATWGKRPKPN
jgi:hypothetical protein